MPKAASVAKTVTSSNGSVSSLIKDPRYSKLFQTADDPDVLFVDMQEIGHGSFGAVYFVGVFVRTSKKYAYLPLSIMSIYRHATLVAMRWLRLKRWASVGNNHRRNGRTLYERWSSSVSCNIDTVYNTRAAIWRSWLPGLWWSIVLVQLLILLRCTRPL